LSRKINYYDEKFLKPFELEDVSTVSGYYNYKKKVKNYIFGTDAKK
jgi:hypothetical protein